MKISPRGRLRTPLRSALVLLSLGACEPLDPPPPLSDAFIDQALGFLNDRVQTRSIVEGREYCGYFGLDEAGEFRASGPVPGGPTSCDPRRSAAAFKTLASYHSHGNYIAEIDGEVPSVDDIETDARDNTWGFVATPGGRVWLIDGYDRTAQLLCPERCLRSDPAYVAEPVRDFYDIAAISARQQ